MKAMTPAEQMQLATAAMGGDERAIARLRAAGLLTEGDHLLSACVRLQQDAVEAMSPAEAARDRAEAEREKED